MQLVWPRNWIFNLILMHFNFDIPQVGSGYRRLALGYLHFTDERTKMGGDARVGKWWAWRLPSSSQTSLLGPSRNTATVVREKRGISWPPRWVPLCTGLGARRAAWTGIPPRRCCPGAAGAAGWLTHRRCSPSAHKPNETEAQLTECPQHLRKLRLKGPRNDLEIWSLKW